MNRSRPKDSSQSGRILRLLESANGQRVSLLEILNLRISQYSARIYELRHKYGFRIENGSEAGKPDYTWFRLVGDEFPSPDTREDQSIQAAMRSELEAGKPSRGLFPVEELNRTAKWEDVG